MPFLHRAIKYAHHSFFVLFLCFLTNGCTKKSSPSPRNILHINFQMEPSSLDPRLEFEAQCIIVIKALFEGLTRIGLDGKPHLALAESIDISVEETIYTFKLRPSNWSNGKKVLAEDFAYAWLSFIASDSPSSSADLFYIIKNAKLAKERKISLDHVGIKALDENTLQVELEHPAPYFLTLIASPLFSPICKAVDQSTKNWASPSGLQFVGNGPFSVKFWNPEQQMVLVKNPHYYDAESVKLKELHISFVKDPYTALLMYEKGEIDWMGEPFSKIPLDAIPDLIQSDQLYYKTYAGLSWLECNTDFYPLSSCKIRKALAYALNRKALVEHIFLGQKIANGIVPENMRILNQEELFIGDDTALAKELFQEGLKELKISYEEFPPLTLSYTMSPGYKSVAEEIQQQWKEHLGITVNIECFEPPTYLSNFIARKFQIAQIGWISVIPDPIANLQVFRYRESTNNWSGWEDEKYKELLAKADYEIDQTKRREILREAEKILLEEMPVIPLTDLSYRYIKNKAVQNLLITDLGDVDFKWVSLVN